MINDMVVIHVAVWREMTIESAPLIQNMDGDTHQLFETVPMILIENFIVAKPRDRALTPMTELLTFSSGLLAARFTLSLPSRPALTRMSPQNHAGVSA